MICIKILLEEQIPHLNLTPVAIKVGEKIWVRVGSLKIKVPLNSTPEGTADCDVIADFESFLARAKTTIY